MEKVKLTRNQAYALDQIRTYDFEDILDMKRTGTLPFSYSELDDFSIDELGKMYFNHCSYEVEEEFRFGDWLTHDNGYVAKVVEIDKYLIYVDIKLGSGKWMNTVPQFFRHATPEEIKAEQERRLWKSIGREVGEFRVHDLKVFRDNTSMAVAHEGITNEQYANGLIKGFYPAESFITFEQEESE